MTNKQALYQPSALEEFGFRGTTERECAIICTFMEAKARECCPMGFADLTPRQEPALLPGRQSTSKLPHAHFLLLRSICYMYNIIRNECNET